MNLALITNSGTLVLTLGGIAVYNRVRFGTWRRHDRSSERIEFHVQALPPITLDSQQIAKTIQQNLSRGQ